MAFWLFCVRWFSVMIARVRGLCTHESKCDVRLGGCELRMVNGPIFVGEKYEVLRGTDGLGHFG